MEIVIFYDEKKVQTLTCAAEYETLPIRLPEPRGKLTLALSIPILDIHGYWIPELHTPSTKMHWVIESSSAGQRSFPYIAFFNSAQINRFSLGTTNLTDDTRITAKMNQEKCTYDISIEVMLSKNSADFDLILDQRAIVWTAALANWREAQKIRSGKFPEGVWDPVFCTWYAVHAAVTQNWVEENARIAASLGFKTLIIDDGWCFEDMKRVSPETIRSWYEKIGDWQMSKSKFPDFDRHRQRIQALGMKYLLWVAPFLIGAESGLYQEIKTATNPQYNEGCYAFNPAYPDAAQKIIGKIRDVIENYQLDGLKIDFLDYIPPDINEPHGAETMSIIREMINEIRSVKPDALIEFRQYYATMQMLPYGTQFRARDVPFDFIENFYQLCNIRLCMGDRIPIHADPVYWHPQESAVNISRHMIASLVGVPMVSMDMNRLSETETLIIAHWLEFYRKHQPTLNFGKWKISYHQSGVSSAVCAGENESIIILHDNCRLNEALAECTGKIYICNLSPAEIPLSGAVCRDHCGKITSTGKIPCGGVGEIC